jgi:hypothetical protein
MVVISHGSDQYTQFYRRFFKVEGKMPQHLVTLTGVSAGCTEAFVVVSFELVKIRLQDKNSAGKYTSTMDCILKILKNEGPLAFFKGLEATLWRHATWNGGYFSVINVINGMLPKREVWCDLATLVCSVIVRFVRELCIFLNRLSSPFVFNMFVELWWRFSQQVYFGHPWGFLWNIVEYSI